jgi:hypothetical protein
VEIAVVGDLREETEFRRQPYQGNASERGPTRPACVPKGDDTDAEEDTDAKAVGKSGKAAAD